MPPKVMRLPLGYIKANSCLRARLRLQTCTDGRSNSFEFGVLGREPQLNGESEGAGFLQNAALSHSETSSDEPFCRPRIGTETARGAPPILRGLAPEPSAMPNIGSLLKKEISRLCRRALRRETAVLKRASVTYRHDIAALKRQVVALTRQNATPAKGAPNKTETPTSDRSIRFVAKGLPSLRKRLGLSGPQLARLLNVSEQSVYGWEAKKTTPRKEQVAAIAALRTIGKREAFARLEQLSSKPSRKKTTKVRSKHK